MGLGHSPRIVTNGLVMCLDAGNPRSYPGSGTTWSDLSGNGRNGILTNGPTFSNRAITLDGTNDYIELPASNVVIPNSITFTCSIWINAPNTITTADQNVGGRFVTTLRQPGTSFFGFGLKGDGTDTIQIFNLGTLFTYTNSGVVGTGFHNVAFTYNKNLTKLKFYIDGNLKAEHTATTANLPSSDLASLGNITTSYYACSISNFSTYSRDLSDAEMKQNFNALRGRFGL